MFEQKHVAEARLRSGELLWLVSTARESCGVPREGQQQPEGAKGGRQPAAFVTSGLRYVEEHGDMAVGTSKGRGVR